MTILREGRLLEERRWVHRGSRLVRAGDVLKTDGGGVFDALEVELTESLEVIEDGVELGLEACALLV